MTEEKINELAAQVEANTKAIEELKEAFATLDQGMAANTLMQALQEQIANLSEAQIACRSQCDTNTSTINEHTSKITALESSACKATMADGILNLSNFTTESEQ